MNYRLRHLVPAAGELIGQTDMDEWLAEFGITNEVAVRSFRRELNGPDTARAHADAVTARLGSALTLPRAIWNIHQSYVIPMTDDDEYEQSSKAEAARSLSLLPPDTRLVVAAQPGHELHTEYQDGTKTSLTWPLELHGDVLRPATRPINTAEFMITHGSDNVRLDFSAFNEPILCDDEQSVVLTSSEQDSSCPSLFEIPDFALFVKLPKVFERLVMSGEYNE